MKVANKRNYRFLRFILNLVFLLTVPFLLFSDDIISFEQVLNYAIENNAGILVKGYGVASAKGELQSCHAPTDLTFGGSVGYERDYTPVDPDDLDSSDITPSSISPNYIYLKGYQDDGLSTDLWLSKIFSSGLSVTLSTYLYQSNILNEVDTDITIPDSYDYLLDPDIRSYGGASLELSLPLLKSFRNSLIQGDLELASSYLEQQEQELKEEIIATILSVSDAYWEYVLSFQKYNRLIESNQRLNHSLYNIIELVSAGQKTSSELVRMKAAISKSRTEIIMAKNLMISNWSNLQQVLGMPIEMRKSYSFPVDSFSEIPLFENSDHTDVMVEDTAIQSALTNSPEIKSLQQQLKMADLQLRMARVREMPDLNLSLSLGYDGIYYGNDSYYKALSDNVMGLNFAGTLSFSMPIQNSTEGDIVSADAEYQQARLRLNEKIMDISMNIHNMKNNVFGNHEALMNLSEVVDLYKELTVAEQKRFEAGLVTVDDLSDLEDQFVEIESQFDSTYKSYLQSIIMFKYYSGNLVNLYESKKFSIEEIYKVP